MGRGRAAELRSFGLYCDKVNLHGPTHKCTRELSLTVYAAYLGGRRILRPYAFCVFAQSLVTSVAYCVLRIALWKLAVTSVVHCVLRIVVWSMCAQHIGTTLEADFVSPRNPLLRFGPAGAPSVTSVAYCVWRKRIVCCWAPCHSWRMAYCVWRKRIVCWAP